MVTELILRINEFVSRVVYLVKVLFCRHKHVEIVGKSPILGETMVRCKFCGLYSCYCPVTRRKTDFVKDPNLASKQWGNPNLWSVK